MMKRKKPSGMPIDLPYGEFPFFDHEISADKPLSARQRNAVIDECEQAIRNAPDCGCGVPCDCFGRIDAVYAIRRLKEAT